MDAEFNVRAQRIIALAKEEARTLNHDYIGTEHILLGLIDGGEGIAIKTLESLGISLQAVRQAVEKVIIQGRHAPSGQAQFTRQAATALELSRQEATRLGHSNVGTEHILLGLILQGDGVAAQVLLSLGASLARIRQQVIQFRDGFQGKKPARTLSQAALGAQQPTGATLPARATPSVLARFGGNLTQQAREGRLFPSVGRDQEIGEVIRALCENSGSCPLVIGDIAGRTTVIAGLAQRIVSGEVPQELKNGQLYYCDPEGIGIAIGGDGIDDADLRNRVIELIATFALPGSQEDAQRRTIGGLEVLAAILEEARTCDEIILVLDQLPKVAADPRLKPMLTSPTRRIIGAASLDDYRKYIEEDDPFTQHLRLVHVTEPTTAYTIGRLKIALRATAQAKTATTRPN
jgi:ATP-dependent Clp protease ATP-binding subunit ClpC